MSTIVIRYDGVDITADVVIKDAMFTMNVNGVPGTFTVRVKDPDRTRSFRAGKTMTLDIDGVRFFGGHSIRCGETYSFPVDDTSGSKLPTRFWTISGVDWNILLQKRVLYDHANPTNMNLRTWPAGSRIDTVVNYIFDNYTDLPADGVTRNGVTDFGSPNPDQEGTIGTASIPVAQAMGIANSLLNGVFYITPDKDFTFVDTDTVTSPYTLTDNPSGAGEYGFREMTILYDGGDLVNDQLSWGVGQSPSPVFARVQDAASIAEHDRWQGGEMVSNIFKQASINKRADAIVNGNLQSKRGHKDDKKAWQVTLFQPVFRLGEKVAVRSDVFGITDVLPVRRMTIKFPSPTKARFDLVLSHELDVPWTIYEFWFPKFGFDFPDIDIDLEGYPPPEWPDPELPGDFTGVNSAVTTLHLADRDAATSYEFHIFNHFTDAFNSEEHFHVKPENNPTTGGGGNTIPWASLLSSVHLAEPPYGSAAWPHILDDSEILRGTRSYGRYLSFALPAGAYYAKVRWDRLMFTNNRLDYDKYDASGWPFNVRTLKVRYPDQYKNVGLPVVLRRGYWGTEAPTLRPTEWGETIESTTAFNRILRYEPPPGHYSTSWNFWEERNYPSSHFPFEAIFPISPGEQYLQFWLWWVEPRPLFELVNTLTNQETVRNGETYPVGEEPLVSGDLEISHPAPGYALVASPLLESDVVEAEIGGAGDGLVYPGLIGGMEIEVYSRTQSVATGGRITACHRAVALNAERTIWGVPAPYVPGSTNVYFSGAAQRLDVDYTESWPEGGQILFMQPVPDTESVTICFVPNGSF